jgi:hypothetical protein
MELEQERFAPGARVVVRDEEWMVRGAEPTGYGDQAVHVTGISELVRGRSATFLHPGLDRIRVLDPRHTELVPDDSPGYRRTKLYLESLLRRVPPTDHRIYLGHRAAMTTADYQLVPAARALAQHRARLLIADAVGLGKTLEVGIALSELIRRGRGRRILVVALKSVLEQFQQELWTRFAIPLVRLDSDGLSRVQRSIPANSNPFHHFDRVIISVDTLKRDSKYARLLEQCHWDVTVIDECQHVAERGKGRSQRAQLARLLSRTCDSLFLTSATPHDGRPESFASLMNLLEPTAVPDPKQYKAEQIRDLYVRRFKKHVSGAGSHFLERKLVRHDVAASAAEDALFAELSKVQFTTLRAHKGPGGRTVLFRTLLIKGLLSSPEALAQTLAERKRRLTERSDQTGVAEDVDKLSALERLTEAAQKRGGSKEATLLSLLEARKGQRVVVFSERIKTLERLQEIIRKRLKLGADEVRQFVGGMPDSAQQELVKEFGTENGKVKILLASDAAAEGINLHHYCHCLIHYDIPWSLITLEQRNGRIDRFGQTQQPEIHYLLCRPSDTELRGDLQVLDRLIDKEQQAHDNLGDAQWLMRLFDPEAEAERVAEAISQHEDPDDFFADDEDLSDLLAPENDAGSAPVIDGEASDALLGTEVEVCEPSSLYESDFAYVKHALSLLEADGVVRSPEYESDFEGVTLALSEDLEARFSYLPPELKRSCEGGHVRLSADRDVVQRGLIEARKDTSRFPRWQLMWPLHPVLEWIDDRVLTQYARHEAPVLRLRQGLSAGEVVFLMDGVLSNQVSQPVLVRWFGVSFAPGAAVRVRPFDALVPEAGLRDALVNDGRPVPAEALQGLRARAVAWAEQAMLEGREQRARELRPKLKAETRRIEAWKRERLRQLELDLGEGSAAARKQSRIERERDEVLSQVEERKRWIEQRLTTSALPYIRLAAVLIAPDVDEARARALVQEHGATP